MQDVRGRLAALSLRASDPEISVKAVLETSYLDLNEDMQKKFARLGVFAGPRFYVQLANIVFWPDAEDTERGNLQQEAQDIIDEFVERSMLQVLDSGIYRLHELWHEYAHAQITTNEDELRNAQTGHAKAYVILAANRSKSVRLLLLEQDFDEILAALNFTRQFGHGYLFIHLAYHIQFFLIFSGRWGLANSLTEEALGMVEQVIVDEKDKASIKARFLATLADIALRVGRFSEARSHIADANALIENAGTEIHNTYLLTLDADLSMRDGDYDRARNRLLEALAVSSKDEDTLSEELYQLFGKLGNMYWLEGKYDLAAKFVANYMTFAEENGDLYSFADAITMQAEIGIEMGTIEMLEGVEMLSEAIKLFSEVGVKDRLALAKSRLSYYLTIDGNFKDAETNTKEALTLYQELGDMHGIALCYGDFTHLFAASGNPESAFDNAQLYLHAVETLGDSREIAIATGSLANIESRRGNIKNADKLYKRAISRLQKIGDLHEVAAVQSNYGMHLIGSNRHYKGHKLIEEASSALKQMGAMADAEDLDQAVAMLFGDKDAPENVPINLDNGAEVTTLIASNTIAVMTTKGHRKPAWLKTAKFTRRLARQLEKTQLCYLLDAVIQLMEGKAVAQINLPLEGIYAACWLLILKDTR